MKIKYLLIILLCALVCCCNKHSHHEINFYYWKTNFAVNNSEKEYFNKLECKKLYLRLFDVDKQNDKIIPVAKINLLDSLPLETEYIPVVFITNRTFSNTTKAQISELAKNIYQLISQIQNTNKISNSNEIQIDCDWSESTKTAYFEFIKELKKISDKNISCTIRLHQIKYSNKTGAPPVDKGYLMCYATSNPEDESNLNSILDLDLLKEYTESINDYPLTFDIALPLYSWAIVTNHLGKIKLINGITEEDLKHLKVAKISENTYKTKEDIIIKNIFIGGNFTIKIEQINPQILANAKKYLSKKINSPYNIIYYHLDENFLKRFAIEDLKK